MSDNKCNCIHHYFCEVAEGPTSRCQCKFCGAIEWFNNFIEGEDFKQFTTESRPLDINDILPFPNNMIY